MRKKSPTAKGARRARLVEKADQPDEQVVVYGKRPIEELLRRKPSQIEKIVARDIRACRAWLERLSIDPQFPIEEISESKLAALAASGNHQGVAAFVGPFQSLPETELIKLIRAQRGPLLVVIAEELTDPRNLGAVIRVCEGAGVFGIFVTERRSSPINGLVRRTSAGATEFARISVAKNLHRTIESLKDAGVWIVGTDLSEGAQDLYEAQLPDRLALVLGSEGQGMRELTRKLCDFRISIPMSGVIQSLNVSTAASAVLFELRRAQLRQDAVSGT